MKMKENLIRNIVVEFPENPYTLTIETSPSSPYEYVSLGSTWRTEASNLFRWFRNTISSCTPENGRQKVSEMISIFQNSKNELFGGLREYVLVEGIIETAYRLQLQDTEVICQVLHLLYDSWSTFGPLHFKAVLGHQTEKPRVGSPHFLAFFLEHARQARMEYGGVRMIDISVYSCAQKAAIFLAADVWCWKQLLIYLQYGARFERLYQDATRSTHGVSCPLTDTLRTLIRHFWYKVVQPAEHLKVKAEIEDYCSNLDQDTRCLCRTFNILLRAVRSLQPGSLNFILQEVEDRNRIRMIPSVDILNHPSMPILIPMLFKRYECPEELKHICRWTIRNTLNKNWQLPHGIGQLKAPRKIKQYLNLLSD